MESNGTGWLADSLQAVDNKVEQLLKLIEDKNIRISNDDSETEDQKRSEIATYMNDLRSKYHLLAERYSLLAKERGKDFHKVDENPSSPFYTPVSKFTEHKGGLPALGSVIRVTDLSYKNVLGSSSSSSSDSASENSNSELLTNDGVLDGEERVVQNGLEKILIKRIEECETEVQIANATKVKSFEEEVAVFKSKFKGNEAIVKLLKDEIEASRALVEKKDEAISSEKSKVSELEEIILSNADAISKYSEEVQRLKDALTDTHNEILQKDEHHQSEVSSLLEQKKSIKSLSDEQLLQIESLGKQLSALKMELAQAKSSHDAKEVNWNTEMETLSKCADALKHKCDMANAKAETLGAELSHKDNVIHHLNESINHLNSVNADLNVSTSNLRVNQNVLRQLEVRATQSQMALCQAISASDSLNKCIDELRVRVNELEGELEEQRTLVAEGAELKREAIRQLCICLEHYRTEYLELREVVVGTKKRTRTGLGSRGTSSS